jgi:hypothetical protein
MSFIRVAHVVTAWTQIAIGVRRMVVWDAGFETPVSTTFWDNGTTNWIG